MNQNWLSDKVVKLVSLESMMKLDLMQVALVVVPLLRAILSKYYIRNYQFSTNLFKF